MSNDELWKKMTLKEFCSIKPDDGYIREYALGEYSRSELEYFGVLEEQKRLAKYLTGHFRDKKVKNIRVYKFRKVVLFDNILRPCISVYVNSYKVPLFVAGIAKTPKDAFNIGYQKAFVYKEFGVHEYWEIDLYSKIVTVHDWCDSSNYGQYSLYDDVRSTGFGFVVNLAELFG